jgi:hypothetical protein
MRSLVFAAALATALAAAQARAEGVTTYEVDGAFGDVAFALENAIIGRGLVVDHTSHVGEMLNRTAGDVGAERDIYTQADVYLFCSAVLSRKMMEADVENIAHCPYSVFLYELTDAPGTVHVGYRQMPEGAMQEVEALLDQIAREAAGVD